MTILARVLEVSKESTEDKDLDLSESPSVEGCLQPGTVCHSVVQNRQMEWERVLKTALESKRSLNKLCSIVYCSGKGAVYLDVVWLNSLLSE